MSQEEKYNIKILDVMWRVVDVVDAPVKSDGKLPNAYLAEEVFHVSKGTLSNWINQPNRGIPFQKLYEFCIDWGISFDWLLTGKGPQKRQDEITGKKIIRAPYLSQKALGMYPFLEQIAELTNKLADDDIEPSAYCRIIIKHIEGITLHFEEAKKIKEKKRIANGSSS
ncbi:MAG: hypothetical protein ACLFUL_06380 [Desulfobacteraceae bacterium]